MKRIRVIPVLLVNKGKLVKTVKFKDPVYVGDPINAVKIFNDKEVDELIVLDITASREQRHPDFEMVGELAGECFMPLAYGGGITSLEDVKKIFDKGIEKVSLNTGLLEQKGLIENIARLYGSQSVVASVDVSRNMFGKYVAYTRGGREKCSLGLKELLNVLESRGVGEVMINSIDQDGTGKGYDLDLVKFVAESVTLPVIACGGAGTISHLTQAVVAGHASAVAAGSMFVFNGKHKAVLISYPSQEVLTKELYAQIP
ncbi:MAG: AglZ/HisF2 family acetamidino modification protein [Bacteroidia bacterium]